MAVYIDACIESQFSGICSFSACIFLIQLTGFCEGLIYAHNLQISSFYLNTDVNIHNKL